MKPIGPGGHVEQEGLAAEQATAKSTGILFHVPTCSSTLTFFGIRHRRCDACRNLLKNGGLART